MINGSKKLLTLRFKNPEIDGVLYNTIHEHKTIIEKYGYVWWGWWKKDDEDERIQEIDALNRKIASKKNIMIGICDIQTYCFYEANIEKIVQIDREGEKILSPETEKTPIYYNNRMVPAWFKIISFQKVSKDYFDNNFPETDDDQCSFFPNEEINFHKNIKPKIIPLKKPNILHISDLHFGKNFHNYSIKNGSGKKNLINILKEGIVDEIGLVIITGDLVSCADANELQITVIDFLTKICESFNLSKDKIVLVPGNHDIPLDKTDLVDYSHLRPFKNFLKEFYGEKKDITGVVEYSIGDKILQIIKMNSANFRNEFKEFGYINWSELLENKVKKIGPKKENQIRIAILHHHLIPVAEFIVLSKEEIEKNPFAYNSTVIDAGSVIKGLQELNVDLVLHGHQHIPAILKFAKGRRIRGTTELEGLDSPIIISSSGTFSRIPGNEFPTNTFSIIKIDDDRITIEISEFTPGHGPEEKYRAEINL